MLPGEQCYGTGNATRGASDARGDATGRAMEETGV